MVSYSVVEMYYVWDTLDSYSTLFVYIVASYSNLAEATDVRSITLALRTLGSFEFAGKLFCVIISFVD